MKSNQKVYLVFSLLGFSLLGVIFAGFTWKGSTGQLFPETDQKAISFESANQPNPEANQHVTNKEPDTLDFRELREKAFDFNNPSRVERTGQVIVDYLTKSLTEYLKTKTRIEDITEGTMIRDYGLPEKPFEPGATYAATIKVLPFGKARHPDGAIVYFSHISHCSRGELFFVDRSLQATFVRIPSELGGIYALDLKDLDTDGVKELIAKGTSCGSGVGQTLDVFQYQGTTFEPIFKDEISTFYKNKYEIVDIDQDGRVEIREKFASDRYGGFGGPVIEECNACEHVFEEAIFKLENGRYHLAQRTFVETPYLTVSQFLKAISDGDITTAYQYVWRDTYPSLAAFQQQLNDLILYGRNHKWDGANYWGEFEKRGYFELDDVRFYVTRKEPYLITKIAKAKEP